MKSAQVQIVRIALSTTEIETKFHAKRKRFPNQLYELKTIRGILLLPSILLGERGAHSFSSTGLRGKFLSLLTLREISLPDSIDELLPDIPASTLVK